jgi:transposase InsO family protein
LTRNSEKHDISDAEFLVDGAGYLTALARRELSGHLNYSEWNHIKKWFHTVVRDYFQHDLEIRERKPVKLRFCDTGAVKSHERPYQTVTMRIDRFHSFWRGSQASARRWLRRFRHHYNHDRPNQALDGRTPAEEVLN